MCTQCTCFLRASSDKGTNSLQLSSSKARKATAFSTWLAGAGCLPYKRRPMGSDMWRSEGVSNPLGHLEMETNIFVHTYVAPIVFMRRVSWYNRGMATTSHHQDVNPQAAARKPPHRLLVAAASCRTSRPAASDAPSRRPLPRQSAADRFDHRRPLASSHVHLPIFPCLGSQTQVAT